MKIIKLHKRNIAYKHGFNYALRFDSWNEQASKAENILSKTHKTTCYGKTGAYYCRFGRTATGQRPYWINLRYEADLTLILLSVMTDV